MLAITLAMQNDARAQAKASVTVDTAQSYGYVSARTFGFNASLDQGITDTDVVSALALLHAGLIRWPGGYDDNYHWRTNTMGRDGCARGTGPIDYDFDQLMRLVAQPLHAAIAIAVNYGSNDACNGGGDPREAAAWVHYANRVRRYGIHLWTVGNEQWAPWSLDLHARPHDASTYASIVAHQYYPLMKAADPSILVGVTLGSPELASRDWDRVVLARARYDFVEIHLYPEKLPHSDAWLLDDGPRAIASAIAQTRKELRAAGRPKTPIFVGEWNSAGFHLDRQSTSLAEALFVAMAQGELLDAGVPYAAFFDAFSPVCFPSGNDAGSSALAYGTWSLFSTGNETRTSSGGCAPGTVFPPRGSAYPAAQALILMRHFAHPGDRVLATSVNRAPNVRAYAVARRGSYALLLVNTDPKHATTITAAIRGACSRFTVTRYVYDATQYATWSGSREEPFAASNNRNVVQLGPWSITLLEFRSNAAPRTPQDRAE